MPRHFSKTDKEQIKEELITEGKKLFSTLGLKKTTIKDLTEAVGIAKGTFYRFFDSKEKLYFVILEREVKKVRQKYKEKLVDSSAAVPKKIKQLLKTILEAISNNPLLNRVYNTEDLSLIYQKLNQQQLAEHKQLSVNLLLPIIKQWQEEDKIIDSQPEVILGVIRAVPLISLHKKELGADIHPEIMELLTDLIAEGLAKKETK